ncbi:MAG: hypothetical protein ACLGSD_17400 [Acidobacteriota bacterium]
MSFHGLSRALGGRRFWSRFWMALASSGAILWSLEHGWEAEFSPIGTLMHHPGTAEAAFGYRLLLPSLADLVQKLSPHLTDHNAYIATQILAIVCTVVLIGEWAALFLPKLGREFGYVMLALMLCPTIDYLTFYDIAIVGFWTACLLLLYRGHPWWYVVVLTVGTLNHENTLLLVPCALLYMLPLMKPGKLVLFAAAQLGAWCTVRFLVVHFTPSGPIFANHFWDNVHFWSYYRKRQSLFMNMLGYVPWWALAALGWRNCSRFLRCAALSLPELVVITFIFGRFSESRQFVAFIPTCMAMIACYLRDVFSLGAPSEISRSGIAHAAL